MRRETEHTANLVMSGAPMQPALVVPDYYVGIHFNKPVPKRDKKRGKHGVSSLRAAFKRGYAE